MNPFNYQGPVGPARLIDRRSELGDALERLLADERHVKRDANGKPYLLDPLLAEWLKRR